MLTDALGWQSIFYIGIPIGPVVVALVLIGLPVEPVKMEIFVKTDYWGMLLLALFAGTLTAALDAGPAAGLVRLAADRLAVRRPRRVC